MSPAAAMPIFRCLNTESDLDFERERALENKRRFDEALSAMHELGRANQSLQVCCYRILEKCGGCKFVL